MGLTVILPGVELAVVAGVAGTSPSAPATLPQAGEFVALLAALFQQAVDRGSKSQGLPADGNAPAGNGVPAGGREHKLEANGGGNGATVAFLLGLGVGAPVLVTLPQTATAPAVAQSAVIAPRPAATPLPGESGADAPSDTPLPAGPVDGAPENNLPAPLASPVEDVPAQAAPVVEMAAASSPEIPIEAATGERAVQATPPAAHDREPGAAPVALTRLPVEHAAPVAPARNAHLARSSEAQGQEEPASAPSSAPAPPTESAAASPLTEAEPPPLGMPQVVISVVRSAGNAIEADEPAPLMVATTLAPGRKSQAPGEAGTPQPVTAQSGPAPANREAAPAPVAAAPAAPQPVETPPAVQQVSRAVLERLEQGGGEARLHLEPVDLGSITIHVRAHGDRVTVEIQADRGEAMRLLRDHTQDLSQLLGGRGLHLADVSVGLGTSHPESQQQGQQDGRPRNEPVPGGFASLLGLDLAAEVGRHNRLRAAYNPDGVHVYRV